MRQGGTGGAEAVEVQMVKGVLVNIIRSRGVQFQVSEWGGVEHGWGDAGEVEAQVAF
jgi:hypothetical protein